MERDFAFEMSASNIRFGSGATREVGMDLADLGARRVMVLADPNLVESPPVESALESLSCENVDFSLFDAVRVEPTDGSFQQAIEFATDGGFDAFVAVGGGSTMDTAKAANLYSTYPADFLEYVNHPIGRGTPVPGPLKPLIAIPTTAGTGSETTGVAIFDLHGMKAKTGIAHRRLRPTLGIIDPENTRTLPPVVAASTGLDVLSHALESFTAIPFGRRPLPPRPVERPAYQGSNPISDIWARQSLEIVSRYLVRAVEDIGDEEARSQMLLAAAYAGIGFGNAGVHLPHGMSYPVSGMVKSFRPEGYGPGHPMVPHGMAVILNAPAVFRFTAPACPGRHLEAARILGARTSGAREEDGGEILADAIIRMMRRLKMPSGLAEIGYDSEDIPGLVQGTLPQHRVTKLSPRPAGEEELARMYEDAMAYW
ncbi:MAG: iron-containing alcohol dehydrogenase [Acidobacteriota bacterium]|nr:iron-containing alcohol dehydrogenase [Acidobacteriota bacterium]